MNYFMASSPNAKLTSIEFNVKTGFDAEKPLEYGIAHLVEHVLFRDNELKDDMSYLQVFKDKGGKVNAFVSSRNTKYIVTVPSKHSMWALKLLTKMLQNRRFSQSELKKAKQSVMIEIGEPTPLEKILKLSFKELLKKVFPFKRPVFFKEEFGVDFHKYKQPQRASQINNEYLTLAQAQAFYESYYVPKNFHLFIAGNFNQKQVVQFINKKWKNYKQGAKGKSLPPQDTPHLTDRPFYSIEHYKYPSMQVGIKVADISLKDFFIVTSYMEFVADEIMKNVRNKKGETYTAYDGTNIYKRHGKIYVNMDSTSKAFKRNLKNLKNLVFEKTKEDIDQATFEKAKLNLKHSFKNSYEENANSLLYNLRLAEMYRREYNFTSSPIQLIDKLSLQDYNEILKKHIKPKRYVVQKYSQKLLFYYEAFVINIIFLFLSVFLVKKIIRKPFNHFQIRFVKNIRTIPFKIYELVLIVISFTVTSSLYIFLEKYVFYNNKILQSNLITGSYLPSVIVIFLFVGIFVSLLSVSPKKIYLTDDSFYIKSMTYRIKNIPVSKIERFEAVKCWKVYLSFKKLWKIAWRSYMYRRVCPWKTVLLVHLKNGKMILLDCGLTKQIKEGLNQWLADAKRKETNQLYTDPV